MDRKFGAGKILEEMCYKKEWSTFEEFIIIILGNYVSTKVRIVPFNLVLNAS
jgi:hypothetical protein